MRTGLLALALCLLASRAEAAPPRRTEAVWRDATTVAITCRLEFFGPGLLPGKAGARQAAWWCRGAQTHWNRAPSVVLPSRDGTPRPVRLTFAFPCRVRRSGPPTPGWHAIEVVDMLRDYAAYKRGKPSRLMDGYRSWAYIGGGRKGKVSACFANLLWPTVVAHELGHTFGLRDEYDKHATMTERLRRSLGNRTPSLMDVSWAPWAVIQPAHVKQIYANARRYRWWRTAGGR